MPNDVCLKLLQAARRLQMKGIEMCQALNIYNRAVQGLELSNDDPTLYFVAGAAIYLTLKYHSSAITLEQMGIIYYKTLYSGTVEYVELLESENSDLVTLMESIKLLEVVILRALDFKVIELLPINFLTVYLRVLSDILPSDVLEDFNIPRISYALMMDFMTSPDCIKFNPKHSALCMLALTLKALNVSVPGYEDNRYLDWVKAFDDTATDEALKDICTSLKKLYASPNS